MMAVIRFMKLRLIITDEKTTPGIPGVVAKHQSW
jgi:hypothetical protein